MLGREPAALPGPVGGAVRREKEVQPLGRDPGHGPQRRDRLELAQHEPGLLVGLAAGAILGIVLVEPAGRRLEEVGLAGDLEHRGAELAHEERRALLRVVGQHRDGGAVVLDLAADDMAVRHLDRELQELPPALVQGLDCGDACLPTRVSSTPAPCSATPAPRPGTGRRVKALRLPNSRVPLALRDDLIAAIRDRHAILFAGAGVSMTVGLPSWRTLIEHIAEELDLDPAVSATTRTSTTSPWPNSTG